jgi:hypothetical protein
MKKYGNASGRSGIEGYRIEPDRIMIWFTSGDGYVYSYKAPGRQHVEAMKKLALKGEGLAKYINKYIRENYEEQL